MQIPKFLKDPLTHFLVIGVVFFALAGSNEEAVTEPAEENRIVVDRDALLQFVQYRSKVFESGTAESFLDTLDEGQRDKLVRDYVEEEALYREAKALGLEADDYVIRQRLVQKAAFLADAAVGDTAPDEAAITAFYEEHKNDYAIPPTATFAHIYFNAEKRGLRDAEREAERMTNRLNRRRAAFEDAVKYGDRFPFHTNYVERTYDYVASQFGASAADAIFAEDGPFNAWRGPVVSDHGAHVIVVRDVTPGRIPPLAEVRERVADDAARAARAEKRDKLIAETVARYDVVTDLDLAVADEDTALAAASAESAEPATQ